MIIEGVKAMLNKKMCNRIRFLDYIPNCQTQKSRPLIIYLHGAGERGTEIPL